MVLPAKLRLVCRTVQYPTKELTVLSRLSLRKSLRRRAAKRLAIDINELGWRNGVLTILASGHAISGVPKIEKPNAAERQARAAERAAEAQLRRREREATRRDHKSAAVPVNQYSRYYW